MRSWAIAASFIARLLNRYRWIAYVGLAIIFYVALKMIWEGSFEVHEAVVMSLLPLEWIWAGLRPDLLAEFCAAEAASAGEIAEARLPLRSPQQGHG